MEQQYFRRSDFGVRNWGSFVERKEFRIIVNDMRDVARHKDVVHKKLLWTGIQSSSEGNFCVNFRASKMG